MAKKTENQTESTENKHTLPKGARSFARRGEGLTAFVEGEEITGKFMYVKNSEITDRRTKKLKTIRVYVIQLENGTMARIGSRTLLDDVWDEVAASYGGIENIVGKKVSFIRGEDMPMEDSDNTLGTYEVIVYE